MGGYFEEFKEDTMWWYKNLVQAIFIEFFIIILMHSHKSRISNLQKI